MKISEILPGHVYAGRSRILGVVTYVDPKNRTMAYAPISNEDTKIKVIIETCPAKSFARWAVRDVTDEVLGLARKENQ